MINKKIILKIFIIFFIAISTILTCNTSKAAKETVTVSNTDITVYVGHTTTVMLTSKSEAEGVRMGYNVT